MRFIMMCNKDKGENKGQEEFLVYFKMETTRINIQL